MGLFDPIWKTHKYKWEKIAVAAVRKIKREDKLFEIAISAPLKDVRIAAVEGIKNDQLLRKIVEDSIFDIDVGKAAVERIRDERVLRELAMSSSVSGTVIALYALDRIRDQKLLADIALNGDRNITEQAAARITDPDIAFDTAMGSAAGGFRCVYHVEDPEKIKEIALGGAVKHARLSAVERLARRKEVDKLLDVLTQAGGYDVRKKAYDDLYCHCMSIGKMNLSDTQRERLVQLLLQDSSDAFARWNLEKYFASDPVNLQRFYREAKREDLQAEAFACICKDVPAEQLYAYYQEAKNHSGKLQIGGEEIPWVNIPQVEIYRRLSETEDIDPAVLMTFFRDPDTGFDMDLLCIKQLFRPRLNETEGIEALRDEAVSAYLERIPVYSEKSGGKHDEKYCIHELVWSFPRDAAKKYGFTVSSYTSENEDQFGRYTSTTTTVTYNGKSYVYK